MKKPRMIRYLLLAILAAMPLSAQSRPPNVILVALDQCRAENLHLYGNPRATSPNLDRMGAEGAVFTRFYSASPWTAPSYSSMMTSQHPSRHGVTLFVPRGVPAHRTDTVMLAELFKKAGYRTAAFVNNSVAGKAITGQGFDEYDEGQLRPTSITERSTLKNPEFQAPAATARIENWLRQEHREPFFLFVLYFEPHSPYDPLPEDDLFKSDAYPDMTNTGYDPITGLLLRFANLGDQKAIQRLGQLYDGKVHFVDRYFGRVLDTLRDSGMDKNTIVFLTSDHGELLYSHPEDFLTSDHRSLYDHVMHVPAILWGAGIPRGKRFSALTSHIDIAPTLLQLAGLPPKPDAQGESLLPLIQNKKRSVHQYVFGEQDILEPLRSVRDQRYKLILNLRTGAKQLFDLREDPGEKHDISRKNTKALEKLSGVLTRWQSENEPPADQLLKQWEQFAAARGTTDIVDEVTTGAHLQLTGSGWQMADDPSCYKEACYWSEPAARGGKPKTASWRTDNPLLGEYRISIWYGRLPQGGVAKDVPFAVLGRDGRTETVRVDQSKDAGAWREIGVYRNPVNVSLSTAANGRVVVDAVKFERVK